MSPAGRPQPSPRFFGVIRSAPYTSGMGRMLTTLTVALVSLAASPGWAGPTDQLREYTSDLTRLILEEARAGRIRPHVGLTLPLERAAEAHAALEDRRVLGKVLLVP